jgi:hypothetical protein
MRKYEGRLVGILGTVIIHLIAAILFMSFKIKSLTIDNSDEFLVEFTPATETELQEKLIELPTTTIENILQGDEEMLNIARNLANKPSEEIDPSDYVDKVKEELIKSGKLGAENFIDEQKRLKEMNGDEKMALQEEESEKSDEENTEESRNMAANYQGPTRIYYDLAGRTHTYLPIPIYKCQGSGKVVLAIRVTQKGLVISASILTAESTTSDPCLAETAVKTAFISRFNADINSPKEQVGTLTYHFVAQ